MCSLNLNRLLMLFQVNGHQGIIVYCGWADNKKKVQMCSKRHVVCKCLARRRLRQAFVLLVVCWWLLADVALKKQFEAVVALSEQILQVPDPWLWILKRTQTETVSSPTSKDFCDQSNLSQSETWLTHIRWTLLQKQRRPIVPLWNWGPCPSSPANTGEEREIVNIHRLPTQLYLIRSLLDVRAGSNQKKVRVLLTMMKTTSHAAPINNKMSFCINVSSMKDALIPHLSPCLACKSINQTVPTGCTLIHHRPWK